MMDPADADMIVAAFSDALATSVDAVETLRNWSRSHPELEADFAAIAVERQAGETDVDATAVRGQHDLMSRILGELSVVSKQQPSTAAGAIDKARAASVKDAAELRGIAYPAELARRLRLPENILERIVSRRIDAASVPTVLVQQLASTLQASRADILMWLRGPLGGTAGASAFVREETAAYKVSTAFADAIANAPDLDDSDRAYWQSILRVSRVVADED